MTLDDKVCAIFLSALVLIGGSLIAFNIWSTHETHRVCLEARGSMVDDGCRFEVHP